MKTAVILLACLLVCGPALAQTTATQKQALHKTGTIKMWVGIGLVGFGGLLAATSSASAKTSGGGITVQSSVSSKGQLVAGLGLAGGGAYLLYSGLQDRQKAALPSLRPVLLLGKKRAGVVLLRTW